MTQGQWRNQLISDHADIAKRIALKMARRCPAWIAREDLVAAGLLGLTEAARRYDENRAEPFLPFAEQRIRGAVLDELRRGDLLPRRVRQVARKIAATIRALESKGQDATEQTVADAMGVTVEHYRTDLAHLVDVDVESLDSSPGGGETSRALIDPQRTPVELASHREKLARVRAGLDKLESRDVTLLGLHYIEELTFQEIAATLGITASRACQLLWRAVERLRAQLGTALLAEAAA
ncbi:MAG: sigma-70 family RNA polymerase sigma factor [Deltaproteobacteria bacterium]|nr:sigma-70 family RNA polymerase sigma factor [Deltaproteobacteria bacterium]MCW5803170.1 sigma-70 family RNA polymerase sigma factor [Deltaproteobacteria bacterium]